MNVNVRFARPDDSGIISKLIHALAEYERQPGDCHATADKVREQLFERERPVPECIMAEIDGEPIGFALFLHNFSTWECASGLYLEDIFVRPEHRGNGAGKALLVKLAAIAAERGCRRLELSVLDWNEPSIGLYRAYGARPMSGWTVCRIDGPDLVGLAGQVGPGPGGKQSPG